MLKRLESLPCLHGVGGLAGNVQSVKAPHYDLQGVLWAPTCDEIGRRPQCLHLVESSGGEIFTGVLDEGLCTAVSLVAYGGVEPRSQRQA